VSSTHDWSVVANAEHIAEVRRDVAHFSEGGITHLVLEVLAYAVDEAIEGTTDRVDVTRHAEGSISVADNGRGTQVRYSDAGVPMVKPIMSTQDLRFFGVNDAPVLPDGRVRSGMSVVAALSEWLIHTNWREGRGWVQRFERGLPTGLLTEIPGGESTGTLVRFRPDPMVFDLEGLSVESLRAACCGFSGKLDIVVVDEPSGLSLHEQ
jgi:topoisomerase-4 subunit B